MIPFQSKIMNYFFCCVFLFCTLSSFAQKKKTGPQLPDKCQEIDNKKALELFEKGVNKKDYKKEERMKFLEQAIESEPDFVDANFQYGMEKISTLIYDNKPFRPAEKYFRKVIEQCPKYHSDPYYYMGFIYYEEENYDSAVVYLKKFINFSDDDDKKFNVKYDAFLGQSKQMMKYAKFYSEIFKKPVPYDPNVVDGVSTNRDEYLPIISPDNEQMLYTRRLPVKSKDMAWQSDKEAEVFTRSKRNAQNKFDQGQPMPAPFNQNNNEGGASLSIDNKHVYFTICRDEGGAQLNCDVYYSDFVAGEWTEIKKVPGINDPVFWDSQPSIAADGKTLFFSSDRKGGLGGCDIYKTVRDETGKWSPPVNVGNIINTDGNEKSPFMHSDSETLYFSSDGQMGVGGYDIFFTRKNEKGEWAEPKNIGYPINNTGDDLGFFVSTDGHLGYFATNQKSKVGGKAMGGWDIYSFDLYVEARPDAVALLKGVLTDESGENISGAKVELKDAKTKKTIDAVVDSADGNYAAVINLKKTKEVIVTVKKEDHAFSSKVVALKDTVFTKPQKVDLVSKKIEIGQTYALNNIYYETNSADLKIESMIVIEAFVEFLKANPNIKIEIHGHTDNVGDDASNQALSADRAFTVLENLQKMGIPKEQLVGFKGFGKNKPITTNDSEEGRAKNRRTEFLIVGK